MSRVVQTIEDARDNHGNLIPSGSVGRIVAEGPLRFRILFDDPALNVLGSLAVEKDKVEEVVNV